MLVTKKATLFFLVLLLGSAALTACGAEEADDNSGRLSKERRDYYISYFQNEENTHTNEDAVDEKTEEKPVETEKVSDEPIYIYERDPYFKESDLIHIDANHNVIDSYALMYKGYNREGFNKFAPDTWVINYCHTGSSDRAGYKSLEVQAECSIIWSQEDNYDYDSMEVSFHIFDYYLGARFPQKSTRGDELYDFSTMMLDNYSEYTDASGKANKIVECDVYYLTDIKWSDEYLYTDAAYRVSTCTLTINFEMPDYYDGIVLGIEPSALNYYDYEGEYGHYYAFDDSIYLNGTAFFRIGHESDW